MAEQRIKEIKRLFEISDDDDDDDVWRHDDTQPIEPNETDESKMRRRQPFGTRTNLQEEQAEEDVIPPKKAKIAPEVGKAGKKPVTDESKIKRRVLRPRSVPKASKITNKPKTAKPAAKKRIKTPAKRKQQTEEVISSPEFNNSDISLRVSSTPISDQLHTSIESPPISPVLKRVAKKARSVAKKPKVLVFSDTSSDEDFVVTKPKRRVVGKKVVGAKKKKKIEEPKLSPQRKCPDDFTLLPHEDPANYLMVNLKNYDGTTAAEMKIEEEKRTNALRNAGIKPKQWGKHYKKPMPKKIDSRYQKIMEEFNDIEENYELCVE